ncbi:UvrD-helicase domain-containing protein [Acidovorax sp. NCPPB 4044]|uniref:UvrD-helicase domain-containing protein n=1 Tax=Acidovorax sp. NCPPB 4044 TaxID=2940490 RepID=UPI002302AB11|nr:UvrD-helicase domain-containing protein [Acidovorax sp. NCPPB 4044]MDA8522734.1 UvrD-helicase domain-containing protein [Acidovorax sp. NCPPB 4044]
MNAQHDARWRKHYPTLEQNRALNATANTVLVSALAGTGKTTTLAIKAADLIRHRGAGRILMLAYSESGLAAIEQRLGNIAPTLPRQVQTMTVEQLCAQLLSEQGDALVRITEPLQRQLLVRQAYSALEHDPRRGDTPGLGDAVSFGLDVQAFLDFEARAKQQMLLRDREQSGLGAREYCREHALDPGLYQLLVRYERLRRGLNGEPLFYAPGDCTYEIATQLDALDFEEVFAPLVGRFDAILFDELQDLDNAAMLVLRHLVRGGNGLFMGAGDFNQHIRPGAFSVFGDNLARIRQELPAGTQVEEIRTTYRFGDAICRGLNPLFGVEFVPFYRDKAAGFERRAYTDDEDCARQLLAIHGLVHRQSPREPGGAPPCLHVIVRSPEDSILLEWMAIQEGVHYACKGMKHFYQRREVALLITLMGAMQGCDDGIQLTQGIVSNALEGLLRYVRRASEPDPDVLANGFFDMGAVERDSPVEVNTRAVAVDLVRQKPLLRNFLVRASFDPDAPVASAPCEQLLALPPEACADAGQLCRHPLVREFFAQASLGPEELHACQGSLRALARICAGQSVNEFLGRLAPLVGASIDRHRWREVPSLQLLTVERAKGHEYDNVAVPFVERGRFPRSAAGSEALRERNMLYVALTRSTRRLWLLESSDRPVSPGPV